MNKTFAYTYPAQYYENLKGMSVHSADVVVPIIKELFAPRTVVDVGCGSGGWVAVFNKHGIDADGVDGPWVDTNALLMRQTHFHRADLETVCQFPRQYDVAICLEVAEHLQPAAADNIVASLVGAAPIVVFSAAIPFQGGNGHFNEQWPGYWAAKFKRHGYMAVDCLRMRLWDDPGVEAFYAQNMIVYIKDVMLTKYPGLRQYVRDVPLALVHPKHFLYSARG